LAGNGVTAGQVNAGLGSVAVVTGVVVLGAVVAVVVVLATAVSATVGVAGSPVGTGVAAGGGDDGGGGGAVGLAGGAPSHAVSVNSTTIIESSNQIQGRFTRFLLV
jgi:hypothetical protein